MAHSIVSRIPLLSPQSSSLSPFQTQVDGLVHHFVDRATDWRSLAAMTAGGMAYRGGRIGTMGFQGGAPLRILSIGTGLSAEVSAFEVTHRGLHSVGAKNPTFWRWSGPAGLKAGLLSSLVTFGTLKGFGKLAQGQNLILRHAAQDLGMVLGHRMVYQAGIGPKPEGSFAEQLIQAEATNLQISAGMSLSQRMMPRIHALERGLDLSLSSGPSPDRPLWQTEAWGNFALAEGKGPARSSPLDPKPPVEALPVAETRGGSAGRKKIKLKRVDPLKAALDPLRKLRELREELPPPQEAALLLKLARLFDRASLQENATALADHAMDVADPIKDLVPRIELLTEFGELLLSFSKPEKSQWILKISASEAAGLPPNLRAGFYERIAVLQSKIQRGSGQEFFLKARRAIEEMDSNRRPNHLVQLAQRLIETKDLEQARILLDEISPGKNFKSFALSDLGQAWASTPPQGERPTSNLSLAMALFREARVDIASQEKKRGPEDRGHALAYLAQRMLSTGSHFRDEAAELIAELRETVDEISDPLSRQTGFAYLAETLAKAHAFEMAHELIRKKIHDPESRSALMKSLALQAVAAGRAVEAGVLLETERLKPEDRFEVLLKIADSLDEGQPGTLKEKKAVLEDAQRYILLHEFQNASQRVGGLIQLGLRLAKLNQSKEALDVFKEAESAIENSTREAPVLDKEKTELILARFQAFVLPLIQGDSTLHFANLYEALRENRQKEIPGLATLLGFRTDTFYFALKSLDVLEFDQRAPVKAWLLLGASLRPMAREERKKTAEKVLAALRIVSHSEVPESARLQRVLIRALWNLAPQRLENFLLQLIQEKMDRIPLMSLSFMPFIQSPLVKKSDQNLYQILSWLARHGTHASQSFVSQFISMPQCPPSWVRPLSRALRIHGHRHEDPPKVLN